MLSKSIHFGSQMATSFFLMTEYNISLYLVLFIGTSFRFSCEASTLPLKIRRLLFSKMSIRKVRFLVDKRILAVEYIDYKEFHNKET